MKFMKALHKTKTVDVAPFDVTDVASGESVQAAIDGCIKQHTDRCRQRWERLSSPMMVGTSPTTQCHSGRSESEIVLRLCCFVI